MSIRDIIEAATPGPWECGDHWWIQGADHCQCRNRCGPRVEGAWTVNILTELRAALDAALASEQMNGKAWAMRTCDAWDDFRDLLDTDTIRALLDVAEAAKAHLFREGVPREECAGDCQCCSQPERCEDMQRLADTLGPLVKEADHDRAQG